MEDEHFHANVGGDLGGGRFGDDDHQANGERYGPDRGLFAEDAEERVLRPEAVERGEAGEDFAHRALVERERAEVGEGSSSERAQAAGEHARSCAFHRHPAPPHAHEEQREITRSGDREGLADHKVDFEWLDEATERDGDAADEHGGDFEGQHPLGWLGLGSQHPSVDIVGERARHRDEQAAERTHERGERSGAGDAAEDGADDTVFRADEGGEFEDDLVRALGADAAVEFGQEIAADHAEDGRENVEDTDENHHPHRGLLSGDAVGIRVEADQNVRESGGAADEGDDERVGVEEGIGLLVFGEKRGALFGGERVGGGGDGLRRERAEGGDPRGVLRGFFDEGFAFDRGNGCRGFTGGEVGADLSVVEANDGHQHENRHTNREHFYPILDCLHEGDALHAAERDVEGDHCADEHDADPVRETWENVGEGDARALHLRHGVKETDEEDEADGDFTEERRVKPALGEIGDRVGTEATQGACDEEQEKQVSAGVTHRIPQRIVAGGHDHAGDAHEGRGGEVFAGDGGGVPAD